MGYPQHLQAQPLLEPPTNTDKELKNALQSGQPVLVDFGSNKCIPCRQLRPILKDVAQEFSGKAHVLVIDVFQYQGLVWMMTLMSPRIDSMAQIVPASFSFFAMEALSQTPE